MKKHNSQGLSLVVAGLVLAFGLISNRPAMAAGTGALRVGVARMTHGHVWDVLDALEKGKVEIVGVYEPDPVVAAKFKNRPDLADVPFFDDLGEMVDKTRPEVVTAYGSIVEHLGVVEVCAPRGVHVMVEKPLAYSMEQGLAIDSLARKNGIQVVTNYATTWFPAFHAAYEVVRGLGEIGDIRKVVIHDGHFGPQEIGCSQEFLAWLTDPVGNGGGALIDFGCYGASLMTWLMDGEAPLSVTAVTQQIKPDVYPKVDDEATIVLTYPKAQAIIQASWNWPYDRKDMFIYCKDSYAFAPTGRTLLVRAGREGKEEAREVVPLDEPYNNAFSYLTAVVRGQVTPSSTDLSGLEANMTVTRILDAARISAKEGRTVNLR